MEQRKKIPLSVDNCLFLRSMLSQAGRSAFYFPCHYCRRFIIWIFFSYEHETDRCARAHTSEVSLRNWTRFVFNNESVLTYRQTIRCKHLNRSYWGNVRTTFNSQKLFYHIHNFPSQLSCLKNHIAYPFILGDITFTLFIFFEKYLWMSSTFIYCKRYCQNLQKKK